MPRRVEHDARSTPLELHSGHRPYPTTASKGGEELYPALHRLGWPVPALAPTARPPSPLAMITFDPVPVETRLAGVSAPPLGADRRLTRRRWHRLDRSQPFI